MGETNVVGDCPFSTHLGATNCNTLTGMDVIFFMSVIFNCNLSFITLCWLGFVSSTPFAGNCSLYPTSAGNLNSVINTMATFAEPLFIVVDANKNTYVSDGSNNNIRLIHSNGIIIFAC